MLTIDIGNTSVKWGIWQEEQLPQLKLKEPWWGYNLGHWSPEEDEQAMMSVRGDYKGVGDILAKQRRSIE